MPREYFVTSIHGRHRGNVNTSVKTVRMGANNSTLILKDRQVDAYYSLKGKERALLKCPTGWGKTVVLQFMCSDFLKNNPDWKILIIVPKLDIGSGFSKRLKLRVEDDEFNWAVSQYNNLCLKYNDNERSKKRVLKNFLKSDAIRLPAGRVAISTYNTFINTMGGENPAVMDNVLLVVDECHHIQFDDSKDIKVIRNELGRILREFFKCKSNFNLWLATATFGRGDYLNILPSNIIDTFDRHEVTFDEYWESLQYLVTFQNLYIIYKKDPFVPLMELMLKSPKKTLIFCPPKNSRFLGKRTRKEFVQGVTDIVLGSNEDAYIWTPGDTKSNAIIDLTSIHGRTEKTEFIKTNPDRVYAIITIDMMKEGSDWPPLCQIVDFSPPSASIPNRIQKFGRGTRDYEGKSRFNYYTFLPEAVGQSQDQMRQRLSECFSQLIASLVEGIFFCPEINWETEHKTNRQRQSTLRISDFDINQQREIMCESNKRLIDLGARAEIDNRIVKKEEMFSAIFDVAYGFANNKDDAESLAKSILHYLSKPKVNVDGFESSEREISFINDLNFDDVQPSDIMGHLMSFMSSVSGIGTFKEMRRLIREREDNDFWDMIDGIRNLGNPMVLLP